MLIQNPALRRFKQTLATAILAPMILAGNFSRADNSLAGEPASAEIQSQISRELELTEAAIQRLKVLRDKKPMTGRGWTALDDIVVGGATIGTAGGVAGLIYVLPKLFPKVRYFGAEFTMLPKIFNYVIAGFGALQLAQGIIVYAFVPRAELATGGTDQTPQAAQVERYDVSSLDQIEAQKLLARLRVARLELEKSENVFTDRITPKLKSRLAFISSNVISGGFAAMAIGAGIYLVAGQGPRAIPMLIRIKKTEKLGHILAELSPLLNNVRDQYGLAFIFQGAQTVVTGALIKAFVPKDTAQAAPVN